MESALLEIETRFSFISCDELFQELSFLKGCLLRKERWRTRFYGRELFESGKLLRIAEIVSAKGTRYFLGWKEPDTGSFANIREELQEEITYGVANSSILARLGGTGNSKSMTAVRLELSRLGHFEFMDYAGENMIGVYDPLAMNIKLMLCPVLKYPLLLEIEKIATTKEGALAAENELREFVSRYDLQQRVIGQEPPSLLYSVVFAGE